MRNAETIDGELTFLSLPDDEQKYFVRDYGILTLHNSQASKQPLVNVYLQDMELESEKVVQMILPTISNVRIGSVWKKQRILSVFDIQNDDVKMSFRLLQTNPRPKFVFSTRGDGKLKKSYDPSSDIIQSIYTVFRSTEGVTVLIPSVELFVSAYIPETLTLLYELTNYSIDQVVKRHVKSCRPVKKGSTCLYEVEFYKHYKESTMVFLAYLACNAKTRENVSLIRANLLFDYGKANRLPDNAMHLKVLPYHPRDMDITVYGKYNEEKKIFIVKQILGYLAPSDCRVKVIERSNDKHADERELKRNFLNRDPIDGEVDVMDDREAGWGGGAKYITSGVRANTMAGSIFRVQKKGSVPISYNNQEKTTPEGVAITLPSARKESEHIGVLVPVSEESEEKKDKSDHIENLLSALKNVDANHHFIDDDLNRFSDVAYCHLRVTKTFDGRKSSWARIKKRPRNLILCEISVPGGYIYIVDIERKKTEKYAGIAFRLAQKIDTFILSGIKDTISFNLGRFGKKVKGRKDFPVTGHTLFYHSGDTNVMTKRLWYLIDKLQGQE